MLTRGFFWFFFKKMMPLGIKVLPYLDNELVFRLVQNGERARTWDAKLNGIPGLMGACYTHDNTYSNFGIPSLANGNKNSMADGRQMVRACACVHARIRFQCFHAINLWC